MENHKDYLGMEIQESRVLNETTTVVRYKKGVLHLINHKGVFKTFFFEEVPISYFKKMSLPDVR